MIVISYLIGFVLGWFVAYKTYKKQNVQINKKCSKDNIQIGRINIE